MDEHGNGLLHIAAGMGDLTVVQRLLNLRCKGDVPNRYGSTPFHKAVQSNRIEVVDALIAAGYDGVNVHDGVGSSCSHFASEQGNLEMLQKLVTLGAQLGLSNHLGFSEAFLQRLMAIMMSWSS